MAAPDSVCLRVENLSKLLRLVSENFHCERALCEQRGSKQKKGPVFTKREKISVNAHKFFEVKLDVHEIIC